METDLCNDPLSDTKNTMEYDSLRDQETYKAQVEALLGRGK